VRRFAWNCRSRRTGQRRRRPSNAAQGRTDRGHHHTAATPPPTDSRLPGVGQAIVRNDKGRQIRVIVRPDGFEYDGDRYRSLSAVAKAITGSHCNGFRFFGLEVTK
jgi:hypothetical protein